MSRGPLRELRSLKRHASPIAIGLAGLVLAQPALASPGDARTAAVALGDSYISGEAGRWLGNSINNGGDRDGTDRACVASAFGCSGYDRALAYEPASAANGCHRSNVAPVLSARLRVDERMNLSCSGGGNASLWRSSRGGGTTRGEPSQADQLAAVARRKDVRYVFISTGGNDLGFASIVTACVVAFATNAGPCERSQQAVIDARMPAVATGIRKAIDEVRTVMAGASYKPWQYRLVIQSYPSVIPRARENRYPEAGPPRSAVGNCPLYDSDLDWARDDAVTQISQMVENAAADKGVQFLDLRDVFQGREVCARTTRQADALNRPSPETSEWGRFVGGASITQGDTEESFHPNAYGQMAFGRCYTLMAAKLTGSYACLNTPGTGPGGMVLRRVKRTPGPRPLRLKVRPRRARAGVRRCFSIVALSSGRRVEGVLVRFGGKRGRTTGRGRARRCVTLRRGTHRARGRRAGFTRARARVIVR